MLPSFWFPLNLLPNWFGKRVARWGGWEYEELYCHSFITCYLLLKHRYNNNNNDDDDDDDNDNNNNNNNDNNKNVSVGIHRVWNMKYCIIPVVPGSTGIFTKELGKYLKIMPVKQTLCKKRLCWKHRT